MTPVYRILRKAYSNSPLDGEGAYRFGGRWSSPGIRLVYTAAHLSLAMLEYFVHVDPDYPPRDLMVVRAEIPADTSRVSLTPKQLPENWRQSPAPSGLAVIGDEFVLSGRAAVLIVPSVLAPEESNWLINPQHSGSARIRVHPAEAFQYDSRFFR